MQKRKFKMFHAFHDAMPHPSHEQTDGMHLYEMLLIS